jgi:hypothetical protein
MDCRLGAQTELGTWASSKTKPSWINRSMFGVRPGIGFPRALTESHDMSSTVRHSMLGFLAVRVPKRKMAATLREAAMAPKKRM